MNDLNTAKQALAFLNPDNREFWVQTAMALRDGLQEDGFELFDSWSQQSESYCPASTKSVWRSAKSGGGITFGTLIFHAKQNGFKHQPMSETEAVLAKAQAEARRVEAARRTATANVIELERTSKGLENARKRWQDATTAISHPYADRKGVTPKGLKIDGDDLLVPMLNIQRELCSLQVISTDGGKRFLPLPNAGLFFPIPGDQNQPLFICEGVATGLSVHEATAASVVACFSAGNLMAVATAFKAAYPTRKLIICGDDDHSKESNTGRKAAIAAALGTNSYVVFPVFKDPTNKSDFNDMAAEKNLKAVAQQLKTAYKPVDEWLEPEPLVSESEPVSDYPVSALGGLLADAVQAIAEYTKAPIGLVAHSCVGAAALAVQRLFNMDDLGAEAGKPCSLFLLTSATSGARKSTADDVALHPIHKAERDLQTEYRAALTAHLETSALAKGKEKAALPPPPSDPRTIFREPTLEHLTAHLLMGGNPSIGLFSDEAGFLGGASMKAETRQSAVAALITLFDSGKAERLRRGDKEACGSAYDRRLSLHLMAQPALLAETLQDPLLQAQGFLPRCLFVAPPSLHGTRFLTVADLDKRAHQDPRVKAFWTRISELMNTPPSLSEDGGITGTVIPISRQALDVWVQAYNEIERGQKEDGEFSGALIPFASRAAELAKRLATVLAGFHGEHQISGQTMLNAFLLVGHSLGEWSRVLNSATEDVELVRAEKLRSWLIRNSHVRTFRELAKVGPKPRPSANNLRSRLGILKSYGWLRSTDDLFATFVVWGDQ